MTPEVCDLVGERPVQEGHRKIFFQFPGNLSHSLLQEGSHRSHKRDAPLLVDVRIYVETRSHPGASHLGCVHSIWITLCLMLHEMLVAPESFDLAR